MTHAYRLAAVATVFLGSAAIPTGARQEPLQLLVQLNETASSRGRHTIDEGRTQCMDISELR